MVIQRAHACGQHRVAASELVVRMGCPRPNQGLRAGPFVMSGQRETVKRLIENGGSRLGWRQRNRPDLVARLPRLQVVTRQMDSQRSGT